MNINFKYKINDYSLYEVAEINSTNTYFKDNYDKYSDKSILIALRQTAGRGRIDHVWVSENDLTFSILFNSKQNYQLPALAVLEALKEYNIDTKIKWPNDIFYNNMKICGILIEDIYLDKFYASIVGIGINLTDKEEFNVKNLNKLYDIDKYELLSKIAINYDKISELNDLKRLKLYKENSLVLNKKIIYNGSIYNVIDINEDGSLKVEKDGILCDISYGDIELMSVNYK